MSLSVRPVRRITSRSITRSQSFTGVNTQERPYRNLSVFSTPGISRKSSRASGLFTMSTKANPPPKVPQPERLDEVYNALKRGLQSYLHVYQMDLENINRQIRMSKRNSRLVCSDHSAHKLKIHSLNTTLVFSSQVEEFYEAYCLQRKLRDGAHKIVKAYTANPGSKEAKESLGEASKGYKECTENMCVMENDFENQLGEFHIRLKGTKNFTTLLHTYLHFSGPLRIEINGKQVWDSEETVFLPLINEFLSVKVTELKSLANHVVVGNVSCEMKDLFAPLTQVVAVDINDLGTLKLSLEVTWNPFDKDDQAGLVNKTPTVSSNILRQPGTPPVRSQPFPVGFSLFLKIVSLKILSGTEPVTNGLLEELDLVGTISPSPVHGQSYARSLSHISESSTDGFVDSSVGDSGDVTSLMSGISINDIEIPRRTSEPASSSLMHTDIPPSLCVVEEIPNASPIPDPLIHPHEESFFPQVERDEPNRFYPDLEYTNPSTTSRNGTYRAQKVLVTEDRPCVGASWLPGGSDSVVDSELEDALEILLSSLDDYRGQFPELQTLEQNLRLLQVTLKVSMENLNIKLYLFSTIKTMSLRMFCVFCSYRQEHGDWDSPPLLHSPLTTSCATLDSSLVVHLKNCTTQLLRLGTFGPLCCGEMYALDKLLRETRVFEIILRIVRDNPNQPRQPAEVIPELGHCFGALSLWEQSTECGTVYCVSVENFLSTLSTSYSSMAHGGADAVFLCLVEQILDQRLPRRGNTGKGIITVFQLWSYLESNGISDIEMHIAELAEEVFLVLSLRSTDLDVIINTLRRPPERNLRRGELHAVAKLLKDPRGKVSTSASSLLRGLTAQPTQREQALVHCLELLEDEDIDTRVCGCKALACLKAKESIEQLVYICQTDKEDVRDAAKQALLTLGEEGKMAYRHVEISQDSLPRLFAPGSMASTAF
uniref:RHO family interacting cell polarization regulator 1 n=1 Tax=Xiphophorus couchianus TaxID=32473 RepID=A0A3B5LH77_9TELE